MSMIAIDMSRSVNYSWVTIIFPTKLRDNAIAMFTFTSRIFTCVLQGVMVYIALNNFKLSIWIFIIQLAITILIVLVLPKNDIQQTDSEIEVFENEDEIELIAENKRDNINENSDL